MNTPGQRSQTIETSLGQHVDVVVKGFEDSPLRYEQLVQSINEIEGMLGVPFPSPRVTMTRVGNLNGGFCGHNQLEYAPRYFGAPYVVSDSTIRLRVDNRCDDTFSSVAHEVAHTWFHGNDPADWIDEGLANAIEHQVVASLRPEGVVYPPTTYCESYRNIAELERGRPVRIVDGDSTGFECNYDLGDGIFGALREYFGDEEFNRRVAPLARRSTNISGRAHTIEDIRESLGEDEAALDIINTWYAGRPEMRKYRHLDAVEWIFPPTIDGEYLHFAGRTAEPGIVHDFVLGKDPYCSQFPLYRGIGRQEWIASVADPLPAGWHHNSIPKLVVISHQINSVTGHFRVTAKINEKSLLSMNQLSLAVRSRVTTGADGLCKESVTYSQVPIVTGSVPVEFKVARHYSLDAIEWISPPTINGNTLRFVGKSLPGAVRLTHREGYCSQFFFYERDERGYHYIDNLAPLLSGNQYWIDPFAEVTSQRVGPDGTFEAIVKLSNNALAGYRNPVLMVETESIRDRVTNKCGESDTLSAADIR